MKRLNDFYLNERTKAELSSAIALKKLPHAVIITGASVDERLSLAKYISASFLCQNVTSEPCFSCVGCKKIFDNIHPDVSVFEREKDKKEFSVKLVRDFIKPNAFIKPNEAEGRVFIIKDGETMNVSAQNALLKILEEPPKNVKFIILTESLSFMLETIRSRCTVYQLPISEESDEVKEKANELASQLALSLLSHNEYDFMSKTGVFEKDKELFSLVLKSMQVIFRDALAIKTNSPLINGDVETSNKLASSLGVTNLIKLVKKTDELSQLINKNANYSLLLTRFSSVLRQSARG